jgi:hypothetical protein
VRAAAQNESLCGTAGATCTGCTSPPAALCSAANTRRDDSAGIVGSDGSLALLQREGRDLEAGLAGGRGDQLVLVDATRVVRVEEQADGDRGGDRLVVNDGARLGHEDPLLAVHDVHGLDLFVQLLGDGVEFAVDLVAADVDALVGVLALVAGASILRWPVYFLGRWMRRQMGRE